MYKDIVLTSDDVRSYEPPLRKVTICVEVIVSSYNMKVHLLLDGHDALTPVLWGSLPETSERRTVTPNNGTVDFVSVGRKGVRPSRSVGTETVLEKRRGNVRQIPRRYVEGPSKLKREGTFRGPVEDQNRKRKPGYLRVVAVRPMSRTNEEGLRFRSGGSGRTGDTFSPVERDTLRSHVVRDVPRL